MEVDGLNIKLDQSEVNEAYCPVDPKWISGFIRRLGIDAARETPKVSRYLTCPSVLEAAGYRVQIVADAPEDTTEDTMEEPNTGIRPVVR